MKLVITGSAGNIGRRLMPAFPGSIGIDRVHGANIVAELMTLDYEGRRGETGVEEVFVKRIPEMDGTGIENSFPRPDLYGKPEVILQFTKEGKTRFADVTRTIAALGQQSGKEASSADSTERRCRLATPVTSRRHFCSGAFAFNPNPLET